MVWTLEKLANWSPVSDVTANATTAVFDDEMRRRLIGSGDISDSATAFSEVRNDASRKNLTS